ncbi:MAG: hypothetical protein ACI94Y_000892 [Maribacter sp.]|jgi:hypothetical protein
MESNKLKRQLKERIAMGLNVGLKSLSEALNHNSIYYNDLLTFKGKFNDLKASQMLMDYSQSEIGFMQIRVGLFALIDKLTEADVNTDDILSAPKNNELQYRKNNFFRLLELHIDNLEKIIINYGDSSEPDIVAGRVAIHRTYTDSFRYNFRQPRRNEKYKVGDIVDFSKYFFSGRAKTLEVYFNTIKFILNYISDEELEKDFFMGVIRSILSSSEKACILYYAISGLDDSFKEILFESELLDESIKNVLLEEEHYLLLNI